MSPRNLVQERISWVVTRTLAVAMAVEVLGIFGLVLLATTDAVGLTAIAEGSVPRAMALGIAVGCCVTLAVAATRPRQTRRAVWRFFASWPR
jgi:hypothetical protein